ncbi:MAG: hypothetical protein JWN02_2811, partial [Acidobacteria bacterium]|nr:hypothetical protein [Acidobacteriota bacterium]
MNRFTYQVILSVALISGLAACQQQPVSPAAPQTSAAAPPSAAAPATAQQPAAPKSLTDSAELAEVTYDAAKVGKWSDAANSVAQLRQSAASYPTLATAVSTLAVRVQGHDRLESMIIANELTRQANEGLRSYPVTTPVDVAILDYEGRALEIAAARNSLPALQAATKEIRRTWDEVRPQVDSRGGTAESSTFESLIAQLEHTNS